MPPWCCPGLPRCTYSCGARQPSPGDCTFRLRDQLFASLDAGLGVNVGAVVLWMNFHPVLRAVLDRSYDLLPPFLLVAALAPALLGKKIAAERFLAANAIAFVTAVPVFCLLPAIGPWAGLGFPANSAQAACEQAIFAMRGGAHSAVAGIVCLPSFHTVWAVLSAAALWRWRWLRVPATVLAILIVVSTLTTGWHYALDVLAGLVWAFGSLQLADQADTFCVTKQARHDKHPSTGGDASRQLRFRRSRMVPIRLRLLALTRHGRR